MAAAGLLVACKAEKPAAEAPVPVQVMTVALASHEAEWRYVGVIRPRYDSDVGFRVGGKIIARQIDVGGTVAAGDVIAKLDPTDLELSLRQQEAELAAARSSRDQAVAAESRTKALLDKGHVSQAALDQRTSAADEARTRVTRADRGLEIARNQVAYTELKADHAGVVSSLSAEVGQVVAAGQTIARIARSGGLEVEVAIPENQLDEVRRARAEIALWTDERARVAARLREVSPEADRATRTYRARFAIDGEPAGAALGMTATVFLSKGSATPQARVPMAAVLNDGSGAYVWVLDGTGRKVVRRAVKIASLTQDAVVLEAGVTDGEQIVTMGGHRLDAARDVRVVERRAASGQAALAR